MTYTSTDFDKQQAADYTLLVRAGQPECALAIVDDRDKLQLFTTFAREQPDGTARGVLNLPYRRIKVAVPTSAYAFIPEEVFEESMLPTYLRYLPADGVSQTSVSELTDLRVKLLYQYDQSVLPLLDNPSAALATYPTVQPILLSLAASNHNTQAPLIGIDKQSAGTTIAVFNEGRFLYSNDFEVDNCDDINYYLLSVMQHLGMKDLVPMVRLSGDFQQGDGFHQLLAQYGWPVGFASADLLGGWEAPADVQPHVHQFFTLFGLGLCG